MSQLVVSPLVSEVMTGTDKETSLVSFQDGSSSQECNQLTILLYGVGKERDEARHQLKITKGTRKILSKKSTKHYRNG